MARDMWRTASRGAARDFAVQEAYELPTVNGSRESSTHRLRAAIDRLAAQRPRAPLCRTRRPPERGLVPSRGGMGYIGQT